MGTIWMIFSIILWIHLFARIKISFVAPSNNKRHLMYIFTYINQSVPIYWGHTLGIIYGQSRGILRGDFS